MKTQFYMWSQVTHSTNYCIVFKKRESKESPVNLSKTFGQNSEKIVESMNTLEVCGISFCKKDYIKKQG